MSDCKCDAWIVARDKWFYDNHFCEDGVRVEPWTRVKSKVESERDIVEEIHKMMVEDGVTPPKLGVPYREAFQIIHDYINLLRKDRDGSSSV